MKDEHGSSRLRRGGRLDGPLGLILALGLTLTTVMGLALVSIESTSAGTPPCGNGIVDPTEDCDPSSPSGAVCLPNELCVACTCTTCGNGTLDPGEECDLSSPSGALVCDPGEVCTSACTCISTTTTTVVVTTTSSTTTTLLDHFQCYEIRRGPGPVVSGVTVVDQFGSSTVTVSKPNKLCAPTNKEGEDPTAPTHPGHLKAWQDKHNRPKVLNRLIVNQFGSLRLDITRPQFLFVPAAKGLNATPPPLAQPTPDHFQCYKVKRSRGATKFTKIVGVSGQDQFGPYVVDLLKPKWLCAPANKSNEDPTAPTHPEHLLCYKTRNQSTFAQRPVFTNDQFGNQTNQLIRRIELCVPSLKDPGTTTTTTTVTPTTVTTTTVTTTTVTTTTTTTVTTSTTTSSTTTTTLYGSPSRAFADPVRSLLD